MQNTQAKDDAMAALDDDATDFSTIFNFDEEEELEDNFCVSCAE